MLTLTSLLAGHQDRYGSAGVAGTRLHSTPGQTSWFQRQTLSPRLKTRGMSISVVLKFFLTADLPDVPDMGTVLLYKGKICLAHGRIQRREVLRSKTPVQNFTLHLREPIRLQWNFFHAMNENVAPLAACNIVFVNQSHSGGCIHVSFT